MPQRIQLRRSKGWRKPEGAIVVSRPSKWGNRYRVVVSGHHPADGSPRWSGRHDWETDYPMVPTRAEAAQRAVDGFRADVAAGRIKGNLADLRGKDLCCWCPLDQPCHADVLLELANATPSCIAEKSAVKSCPADTPNTAET